jgi:Asp-tRNA(Asn)/Glu-tRNA(Gln) amidotransferase C subunit
MAEDWKMLAAEWEGHKVGMIAEVDCTTDEGLPLCEDFEVHGFPTLLYGDPMSPETYQGEREFAAMSEFAKEHISKPICSVYRLDNCDDDDIKAIAELKSKTEAELESIAVAVEAAVKEVEQVFDVDVENLQQTYDKMVSAFNDKLDKIKQDKHYKYVEQLLSSMPQEAGGDEL